MVMSDSVECSDCVAVAVHDMLPLQKVGSLECRSKLGLGIALASVE